MILSEWNNSAIIFLISIALIPIVIFFFSILWIINLFPEGKAFLDYQKKQKPIIYFAVLVSILATSVLFTYGVFNFLN